MNWLKYTDDRGTPITWRWRTKRPNTGFPPLSRFRVAVSDPLQRGVLILFVLGVACAALVLALFRFGNSTKVVGFLLAPYALWGASLALQWFVILTGRIQRRFREALLSTGRCPACMEQMSGVPVEDDGCVVCANADCRAAWRLSGRVEQE